MSNVIRYNFLCVVFLFSRPMSADETKCYSNLIQSYKSSVEFNADQFGLYVDFFYE